MPDSAKHCTKAVRYTQMLADAPLQSQDCAQLRAGYRRVAVGRHMLYFRVEDYGVAIIRILHGRMDAPRHL